MEIQPTELHERVSVVLGSKNEVERVTRLPPAKPIQSQLASYPVAGVAQSVEQLIRNEKVGCSIHLSAHHSKKETPLSFW